MVEEYIKTTVYSDWTSHPGYTQFTISITSHVSYQGKNSFFKLKGTAMLRSVKLVMKDILSDESYYNPNWYTVMERNHYLD